MNDARARVADLAVLTLLVVIALWWPLVAPPIGTHGEAREGLVVQDLVREGRWALPLRNGEVPSKPPLFHWIAGVVGSGVGLSDAVVRLPSALAAWAVLTMTYALGVAAGGRASGWLAVGALAGMHTFFESATEARVDMVFAACVMATLVAFLRWYRDESGLAQVVCYAAAAAGVLTKGPAGVVLPGLVVLAFLAVERRLDRLRVLWSWRLAAGVAVVVGGWYALALAHGGRDFLMRQVLKENVDRFVGRGVFGMHGGDSRLAMVENLATDLLPWNLVLVWCAVRWWRGEREDAIGRFLHAWWIVIVAFFTVAYGKRGVYLLPLYPAIAVLAGRALAGVLAHLQTGAWRPSWPARPARALVVAVVVVDLAVVLIGQIVRVRRASKASLVPFARVVAERVPATAPLVADPSLDESDHLVLAYRLGRALPRSADDARCVPGTYRLGTPRGVPVAAPLVASARRGVAVVLVQDAPGDCPLALGAESDR